MIGTWTLKTAHELQNHMNSIFFSNFSDIIIPYWPHELKNGTWIREYPALLILVAAVAAVAAAAEQQ